MFNMTRPIALIELSDRSLLPVTDAPGGRHPLLGTSYDRAGVRYVYEGRTATGGTPIFVPAAPVAEPAQDYEPAWHGACPDHSGGHSKGRLMAEYDGFESSLYKGFLLDVPKGTVPSDLSLLKWATRNPMTYRERKERKERKERTPSRSGNWGWR
jgi:hypothetical protein